MLPVAGERCVLGRSHRFQAGMWSCLAGFVEPGEAIEDAVRRETREEAGIICGRVSYFASQPWPFPTSLMIGCHVEALSHELVIDRAELDDARWFEREEVAMMLLRRTSCRPDYATDGRHRLSHHPRLGGGGDCLPIAPAPAARRHPVRGHHRARRGVSGRDFPPPEERRKPRSTSSSTAAAPPTPRSPSRGSAGGRRWQVRWAVRPEKMPMATGCSPHSRARGRLHRLPADRGRVDRAVGDFHRCRAASE